MYLLISVINGNNLSNLVHKLLNLSQMSPLHVSNDRNYNLFDTYYFVFDLNLLFVHISRIHKDVVYYLKALFKDYN